MVINVRCPDPVGKLIDQVCKLYGCSRADLMRTGTIDYCQKLLLTDTLQRLSVACHKVSEGVDIGKIDKEALEEMDKLSQLMLSQISVPETPKTGKN